MEGVNAVGKGGSAQNQVDGPSRRPGTANHPGKHLGQFKHAQAPLDNAAALPLVQQQLSAVNGNGGGNTAKAANQYSQQTDQSARIIQEQINLANNNILDEMKFMSRFNAISTAF